ncbi:MAG: phytol kinase [Myxococcota bacterium]|jgi:phytol kinase
MTSEPTIISEAIGSLWTIVPVGVLLIIGEVLFRFRGVPGEATRKLSHLGSGVVIFCMPWTVQSHWTVLAMSTGFVLVLGGSKPLGLLPSIHAVGRKTSGAQYYPIAVYLIWLLAAGEALLFQIPIAVMALSDTGAAVVGRRYGIVRYRVIEDYRSLGGSVTFFGLTFATVLLGLGLAGFGDLPQVLLITLLTALVTTAVEGISVRGADNLLVPYATFIMMRATMNATREGLGDWVLGTALVLGLLLASFKQARLNATAFMATFVGGTLAWGLGGPVWLATLLVPYFAFAATRASADTREADLEVMVPAFAVSLVLVLAYGHLGATELFIPLVASAASVSSIALCSAARFRFRNLLVESAFAIFGAIIVLIPVGLMDVGFIVSPVGLLFAIGGSLLAPLFVRRVGARGWSPPALRLGGVLTGTSASLIWLAVL